MEDGKTVLRRTVELDVTPEQLWDLIGDGNRWSEWLVDDSTVAIERGRTGEVVDGDESRSVRVDDVVEGRSVRFHWWPSDAPERASTVSLEIGDPAEQATTLRIVEVFPAASPAWAIRASAAWEVRAVAAWLCCRRLSRV